ncbi:hypothetical protein M2437_003795 [Methylorubrum pseudosasae]|nr:hypothetical protein [Methylorubrum pseudosasae]
MHEVGAVELGRDLDGEAQRAPRLLHPLRVGHRADEISAEPNEGFHLAGENAFAGLDRVHPLLAGRLEVVHLLEFIERHQRRLVGDADGALALHVRVAAHGADAGAGPPDIAAQEQQVDEHLHRLGAAAVLGQAHPVDADHRPRAGVDGGGRLHPLAPQPGLGLQRRPFEPVAELLELFEAVGVLGDEIDIENARAPFRLRLSIHGEERLADAAERRDVAAGLHLMVLSRNLRRGMGQHLDGRLRVGEPLQPALPQRVEGDDGHAPAAGVLQRVEHPRRIRTDILSEEQDQVGGLEILQHRRADGDADRLRQRLRGRFVAHVGGVGQVVVAVHAREQRVHVARLQRSPTRRVEHGRGRVRLTQSLQLASDLREGLLPGDGHVAVALRIVAQGVREPTLLLEVVVRPRQQVGDRVALEEVGADPLAGLFPGGRLGAVLAILERGRLGRLRPCTGHAHEAARLVLLHQHRRAGSRDLLAGQDVDERAGRPPSAGRVGIGFDLLVGHGQARFA